MEQATGHLKICYKKRKIRGVVPTCFSVFPTSGVVQPVSRHSKEAVRDQRNNLLKSPRIRSKRVARIRKHACATTLVCYETCTLDAFASCCTRPMFTSDFYIPGVLKLLNRFKICAAKDKVNRV